MATTTEAFQVTLTGTSDAYPESIDRVAKALALLLVQNGLHGVKVEYAQVKR